MEDAHATILSMNEDGDDQVAFFGVYDGHGGEKAAIFTGLHLHELIQQTEAFGQKARICAAGGYVVGGYGNHAEGVDFNESKTSDLPAEEQIVTCYPEVISHDLDYEKDEFVILACVDLGFGVFLRS
ncbi:Protein phosphatase 2C 2 [Clavispora lusitaniae]|nr:Protein phosphatase 2C 2 [Clavispora lusitaniae]